jgi:molecular chaperone GrpE (heat shock protein)
MALNNGDGPPGRPRIGAPGSAGAPGSGGGAARAFQWKGKAVGAGAGGAPEAVTTAPLEEAPIEAGAPGAGDERFEALLEGMEEMRALIVRMSERDTHNEKAFNTLHAELSDYKKDFIYEHLKPVVRPLLFLYDSLEQFDGEVADHEKPNSGEERRWLSPKMVRENVVFFRDQLVEALRICEVTPMDTPSGRFDAKFHKAVRVIPVETPEQDNTIQSVVRSGWFLNGQLLRPAEVAVGRHRR